MDVQHPADPATPKQIEFIKSLLSTVDIDSHWYDKASKEADEGMNRGHASQWINWLKEQPKRQRLDPTGIGAGVYTDGTAIYQVKISKTSNRPWARLVKAKSGGGYDFEYDPRAIDKVAATCHPMTVEAAAALGLAQHWCVVCGRELSDPDSIRDGIGPVCKNRQTALINSTRK